MSTGKKYSKNNKIGRTTEKLTRLDIDEDLRRKILPHCRLKHGDIWIDSEGKHKVGVLDATDSADTKKLFENEKTQLVSK